MQEKGQRDEAPRSTERVKHDWHERTIVSRETEEVVENGGSCTGKSKQGISKDVWGRAGQVSQEGVPQEEAVIRAEEDTKADSTGTNAVVMGQNKKRVKWSLKDLGTSTYSEVDIVARVQPSEGDSDPRCLTRGDGRSRGTYEV